MILEYIEERSSSEDMKFRFRALTDVLVLAEFFNKVECLLANVEKE